MGKLGVGLAALRKVEELNKSWPSGDDTSSSRQDVLPDDHFEHRALSRRLGADADDLGEVDLVGEVGLVQDFLSKRFLPVIGQVLRSAGSSPYLNYRLNTFFAYSRVYILFVN